MERARNEVQLDSGEVNNELEFTDLTQMGRQLGFIAGLSKNSSH